MHVVMLPGVSGGIGHISRTSALARTLMRLEPSVNVHYVLDTDRLRSFNIEAAKRMGFQPILMPARVPENRDRVIRSCFGFPDIIIEDCSRYLVGIRRLLPEAAWISIPTHPIGDEL